MALPATVYTFDIDLADHDRRVYESLALRVARHPSESEPFFVARVIAYLLEVTEGIEFSRGGLSDPDEQAIGVRDLTGRRIAWIEVGTPDAARLHKAAKATPRVAVYLYKNPAQYLKQLTDEHVHNAATLELHAIDSPLIQALVERLERRMAFSVSVSDRDLFITIGDQNYTGQVARLALGG